MDVAIRAPLPSTRRRLGHRRTTPMADWVDVAGGARRGDILMCRASLVTGAYRRRACCGPLSHTDQRPGP